ncbi:hypothetical protein Aph02nite_88180 [Actinoplanes philippinensis]|uniref:SWIM-type domain-containing protein n=1 Tax=Actinoplanes philippinensis TaxID=35752 RepID=A0A1I2M3S9_9ACTN|nr:hypothetical protein [Actinoplanes philippinensis]GIE82868.1 hypothetical protein Aph02nite_88180 [Actinoplanes philippinensis]SFF84096.1 hypothetical protein SAMN05421541_12511 [Actinoplanes philippinensis]
MNTGTLPVRADLRALDADALAALANRGLVKRATREVEREPPALSADGSAIIAEFSDGVRATLPQGGLEQGGCTCGATGVCRHLIGLILAYQTAPAAAPSASTPPASSSAPSSSGPSAVVSDSSSSGLAASRDAAGSPAGAGPRGGSVAAPVRASERIAWSPGAFTDDQVTARIGARLVTAARRAERAGYTARVRRGPVPVVELPAATVRFLVPGDLGYVHTDARAGVRDDVIALAVWAFRVADEQQPDATDCVIDVGGAGTGPNAGSGLEALVEFAAEVLRGGAVHSGAGLAATAAGQLTALERAGLRWPLDAATELAGQLTAYRDRSARYSPELFADLLAELFARHRAAGADGGAAARARVLGSEEAAETPLRRVRLDGLGARVTAIDDERRVEIFHGQPASGVVLVSQRQWTTPDDGPALARRRIAGTTVAAVAAGTLVTESAVRSASRAVRLSASRVAKSTVTASHGAWDGLPDGLLVRDYARLAADLDAMPPRPVRARVRAELVRVLAIAQVGATHYSPGAQRLTVEILDVHGNPATVVATHAAVAPGRLDAVAAALGGRRGKPRYVAGSVHRSGGRVVIDPYAIAADGPPVIPDLATAADFATTPAALTSTTAPADGGPATAPADGGPATVSAVVPEGDPGVSDSAGRSGVPDSGDGRGVPDAAGRLDAVDSEGRLGASDAGGDSDASGPVVVDVSEPTFGTAGGAAGVEVWDSDDGTDVLAEAVAAARDLLAEAAHSGLAHLPPTFAARLSSTRGLLARVGLHRVASALDEVSAKLSPDPGIDAANAWADAYLRVSLAADLL